VSEFTKGAGLRATIVILALIMVEVLAAAGCALFTRSASPEADAARRALVAGYEARLLLVASEAGPTCTDVLRAIVAEEKRWAPVWIQAGVDPEPPRALVCPEGGAP